MKEARKAAREIDHKCKGCPYYNGLDECGEGACEDRITGIINNHMKASESRIEKRLERARGELKASERLCQIYFDIATESTNEEWVRARRDKKLESIADTGGEG